MYYDERGYGTELYRKGYDKKHGTPEYKRYLSFIGPDTVAILKNYSYSDQKTELKIAEGYVIDEILYGTPDEIPAFDAAIFRLKAQS